MDGCVAKLNRLSAVSYYLIAELLLVTFTACKCGRILYTFSLTHTQMLKGGN